MSALTSFKGDSPILYDLVTQTNTAPLLATTGLMDATAEKVAILGCVWHPTVKTGTINIRKVHFRTGAVTFNVLSTVRVSLQNVSATAGPPYQPDGTQDQTYDYTLGAGLTANAWNITGNLSADRVVDLSALSIGSTNSRWVCVVFQYTTFTATDSIIIDGVNLGATQLNSYIGGQLLLNTGSWAAANTGNQSIIALECDDGTFAFMENCIPISTFGTVTTANNATFRAVGLKFRFPMQLTIEGAGLMLVTPDVCDGSIILYDTNGTSVLAQVDIDNDAVISQANPRHSFIRFPPVTLTANSYYRLVFVPSTTTAATIYYADVNAVGLMDGLYGGQDMHWTTRDSGGAWTDTTTRRPHFMLKISSVHDGIGGSVAIPVSGRIG